MTRKGCKPSSSDLVIGQMNLHISLASDVSVSIAPPAPVFDAFAADMAKPIPVAPVAVLLLGFGQRTRVTTSFILRMCEKVPPLCSARVLSNRADNTASLLYKYPSSQATMGSTRGALDKEHVRERTICVYLMFLPSCVASRDASFVPSKYFLPEAKLPPSPPMTATKLGIGEGDMRKKSFEVPEYLLPDLPPSPLEEDQY